MAVSLCRPPFRVQFFHTLVKETGWKTLSPFFFFLPFSLHRLVFVTFAISHVGKSLIGTYVLENYIETQVGDAPVCSSKPFAINFAPIGENGLLKVLP